MNILIMVHSLTGGGAERVAASWANGLKELGENVTILSNTQNQTYATPNIDIIERKIVLRNSKTFISKIIRKLFGPILTFFQLFSLIKNHKFDCIINVLYYSPYTLLLVRLLLRKNIPIIMTDHNAYERPKGSEFKWRQWKNKFIDNKLFDIVTVLTKRDKDILNKKGFKNIEVLYNPLFLKPVKTISPKEKIILAVGRLDAWYVKGFDLLIKIWNDISGKYEDWKLIIVGSGSKESLASLQGLVTNNNDSLIFKSFSADIIKEYKEAAVFVLSSRFEGWGLAAIEAMSQGCATIACDFYGRQSEYIKDKQNGLLCATDNYNDLKSKIETLILNDNLRHILQHNAIEDLDKYSEYNVANNLMRIIKNTKSESR